MTDDQKHAEILRLMTQVPISLDQAAQSLGHPDFRSVAQDDPTLEEILVQHTALCSRWLAEASDWASHHGPENVL